MSRTNKHISDGRRTRAFTLVEAVVVLVIVGVLSAIALPRYAGFDSHRRMQLVVRKIVADLAYAQHLAQLKGANVKVSFDVIDDRYELIGVQDLDHPGQRYRVTLSDEPYVAQMTSANFQGNPSVEFDLYGAPDSGGSVVVERGSHGVRLTIDAETGEVTVTELGTSKPVAVEAI